MPVQMASKEQNQNNHYQHADNAAGIVAPVLTVPPNWKTPYKRYDNNDREDEHEHHVLSVALTLNEMDCVPSMLRMSMSPPSKFSNLATASIGCSFVSSLRPG